ncbi:alkaline phosphatase family protein [Methylococcus sp. EFPC2]|uniref:alkaline phosphatase family protein n=1 Tax=Methylococcus sp. EFPC2 TaxID=2812648 RepID=UPI00196794D3|nr:alkaline phosphatase family protein [Methylococcus sp. EFPC2]QSA98746.1 acid phosphatase [Methylococcus sp. EFPC2]
MKFVCRPLALALALALSLSTGSSAAGKLDKIGHIVVIYLENRSFDHLYGRFPGADGLDDAKPLNTVQIDERGNPYATLPPVLNTSKKPLARDPRFPADLPNGSFDLGLYVKPAEKTGDLTHRFYHHQAQINGGKLNRFAQVSDAGGLTMGHYDGSKLPLWQYALRYTLADHFFQAAYGGSFLNHQWLVCACSPFFPKAPDGMKARLGKGGELEKDGELTPDGYAVNSIYPAQPPYPESSAPDKRLPPQTAPTIGDRLSEKGISWAWYAGGWNDAEAGKPAGHFQFHHQPFVYYQRYAPGTAERREHLKDLTDLEAAIAQGNLPAVSFYKPIGALNEHPGYADVVSGEQHIADLIARIEHSPQWKDTVIVVTYDEYGGFWDHVTPPKGDRFGPGSRIPAIVISPYAKKGQVDHTVYDTTSILKLIENRWNLTPLGTRDAKATSLERALDLR